MKAQSGFLHVEASGIASGPAIIFIHGLGGNSTNFAPLISAAQLGKSHKIITFDWEGHGLSPLSGAGINLEGIAESVKEVLDSVDSQQATVVGHSMGGVSFF